MSFIEEYFRNGLSRKERKEINVAEMKIGISKLLDKVGDESFFIKTSIDETDAGMLVYDIADKKKREDVIVVLDWFGIHVMTMDLMLKRLAKFLMHFKFVELNYYTLQYLGVLLRDKKQFYQIMKYVSENIGKELSELFYLDIRSEKRIIIRRKSQ